MSSMKLIVLVPSFLALATIAFVPQPQFSRKSLGASIRKTPTFTDRVDDSSVDKHSTLTSEAASELGKEIFFSHLEEIKSSELFNPSLSGVAPSMQGSLEEMVANMSERRAEPSSTVQQVAPSSSTIVNIKAVLAASEQAVADAEAAFTDGIDRRLEYETSEAVEAHIVPAASVVGEPITSTKPTAPSVGKILKFAIPAIGVWLCSPLLSLIDTSTVGILSGTIQQAALNPAVAVTDYTGLLVAFLLTGTTNLIAAARETDSSVPGSPSTTKTLVGALRLATFVGAGLGAFLFFGAHPLLRAIIGNDEISPAVFSAAKKYVQIRALGMPAAAVIASAQAACLGMQDIRSPLYVLLAAAVVNFVGDMLFVGSKNAWIGGAAGAAWATIFSQYAALGLFVYWLRNKPIEVKPKVMNLSKAILELTGKPSTDGSVRRERFRDSLLGIRFSSMSSSFRRNPQLRTAGRLASVLSPLTKVQSRQSTRPKEPKKVESTFSVRGFLKDGFRGRDLVKFPDRETLKEFKPYFLPVTTTQIGKVSAYIAMSHVVSSSLGTASMAAQQVIVSLFYCLTPIADSLSLTAQSFVPALSAKKASKDRASALRKTATNFFKAATMFGVAMAAAVSFVPLVSGFFTADPTVVSLVNKVVPLLVAWFIVHGYMCGTEGLLLAQKDLNFMGRMYFAYFGIIPFLMLRVKRAALAGAPGVNLTSVWKVFLGYQLFRTALWAGRVAQLQFRTELEAKNLPAATV